MCPAPTYLPVRNSLVNQFEVPRPYHHSVVRTNVIALSIVLRIVHDTPGPIGPRVYKKSVQISCIHLSGLLVSKFIVSQAQLDQKTTQLLISSKVTNFACTNQQMRLLSCMTCSLVPSPPPQLSSLAVRITLLIVIRTASDNSCGGRPGTRLCDKHFCIPVRGFLGISPLN